MTQKLIVIDACMRDGESRTKKILKPIVAELGKRYEIEMIILEGVSYCKDCKKTYKTTEYAKKCPHCGSDNTYLVTGNELRIKDIAVVDKK